MNTCLLSYPVDEAERGREFESLSFTAGGESDWHVHITAADPT